MVLCGMWVYAVKGSSGGQFLLCVSDQVQEDVQQGEMHK